MQWLVWSTVLVVACGGSPPAGDDTSSSGDESSETGNGDGQVCGNGIVEKDEACDDGNAVDGDGCNQDCAESGTELALYEFVDKYPMSVEVDANGLVGLVGEADYTETSGHTMWIAELSMLTGATEWEAFVGGFVGRAASWGPNGNLAAAGDNLKSFGATWWGLHHNGNLVWQQTVESEGASLAFVGAIEATPGDAIVVTGTLDNDFLFQKRTPTGDVAWGSNGDDAFGSDLVVTGDGGFFLAATENEDVWLRRVASDGSTQWHSDYDSGTYDGSPTVGYAVGGNVLVAINVGSGSEIYVALVAYSPAGEELWSRSLEEEVLPHIVHATAAHTDGTFTLVGQRGTTPGAVAWIHRVDATGERLWAKAWPDKAGSVVHGVAVAPDRNMVVVGASFAEGSEAVTGWVRIVAP